jgi:hypothetical protein
MQSIWGAKLAGASISPSAPKNPIPIGLAVMASFSAPTLSAKLAGMKRVRQSSRYWVSHVLIPLSWRSANQFSKNKRPYQEWSSRRT